MNRVTLRWAAAVFAATMSFLLCASPAFATGTMTIKHFSGKTNIYKNVSIKVLHGALYVTSADGKGTIIVNRAACSYQGKLLVCFATSVTLIQAKKTSPVDLKTGTIYLNDTGDPQQLTYSTAKIPPHSVIFSLSTKRGTYVSLNGRFDQVVK